MRASFTTFLFLLTCMAVRAQMPMSVSGRQTASGGVSPAEQVYIHTDAEDYLQGDRIWLKAYLMDGADRTPVDSTLYVYAELFDRNGDLSRRVKLLRRQGAFYGYLDIPEDFLSGEAYLRAYTRVMASDPASAFTKRLAVGRDKIRETSISVPGGSQAFSSDRCPIPLKPDRRLYKTGDSVSVRVDASAHRPDEWLDLSVSVTCRPLIARHYPASITDYVRDRAPSGRLNRTAGAPAGKETTAVLSGTVRTEILGRPVKNARVSLISPDAGVLDVQSSGPDGRFRFEGLDYPAGTHYLVKSSDRDGVDRYRLDLDGESFPSFSVPRNPFATALDDTLQVVYAEDDNPFGTISLESAGVVSTVDGPPAVGLNRLADFAVTLRQIEERGYTSLSELLYEVPSVFIRDGKAYIRATTSISGDNPAALAVDGTILDGEYDLDVIRMPDVARVDIFKTGQTVLWGARGGAGVISVTTKTGDLDLELLKAKETVHQTVVPLGYQRAADFDKAVGYRNKRTVYWNPQLLSDTFSFRLGDTPGTYLVVVEGVTSDGRLVHEEIPFDVSQ